MKKTLSPEEFLTWIAEDLYQHLYFRDNVQKFEYFKEISGVKDVLALNGNMLSVSEINARKYFNERPYLTDVVDVNYAIAYPYMKIYINLKIPKKDLYLWYGYINILKGESAL